VLGAGYKHLQTAKQITSPMPLQLETKESVHHISHELQVHEDSELSGLLLPAQWLPIQRNHHIAVKNISL
jgi:hypothetical protein